MKYQMTQCELVKGETHTVSWILSNFAKVGKYLKLKGVDGWLVKSTGATKSSELITDMENARRRSWESLPPNGRMQ